MKKSILNNSLYFFLFPPFFILFYYFSNISESRFINVIRPALILFIIEVLFYLLFRWITRRIKAALFLGFFSLLFFVYYGALYIFLKAHPVLGVNLGRHSLLAVIWGLVYIFVLILVFLRKIKITNQVIFTINLAVIGFFAISLGMLVIQRVTTNSSSVAKIDGSTAAQRTQDAWIAQTAQPLTPQIDTPLPDIYYIIPDMFARSDAILAETGYDNSDFLAALEEMGFVIADCSRSNYASTQLSIASSLNLNYLDQIQGGMQNRTMLAQPMNDSLVRKSLESIGYQTIFFDNGFGLPEIQDADITISNPSALFILQPLNPFEGLILSNSFLRIFYDVKLGVFSTIYDQLFFPYWDHVNTQKNIFTQLPEITNYEGAKFVFVHLMVPHPPFLIRADGTVETDSRYYREALGQPVSEELYLSGYLMQVQFVQEQLLQQVQKIIANSTTPPVIIIQGDHGIEGENRMENLNAYYLPEALKSQVYSNITPVNSFRVIFNGLFGTDYPLLPDESWYSVYPDWFDLQWVPEYNPNCVVSQ